MLVGLLSIPALLGYLTTTAAEPSRPDAPSTLALAPLVIDADVAAHDRPDFERAALAGAQSMGRAAHVLEGKCAAQACIERAAKQGLRYVLLVEIELEDRDYEVAATLYSTLDGRQLATMSELCDTCGLDKALATVEAQVVGLRAALEREEATPFLHVSGQPEGLEVWVDGQLRGRAPLSIAVAPGAHLVEVRDVDGGRQAHEWETSPGVGEHFDYDLGGAERRGRGRGLALGGGLGLGLGLGGVALGATFLALDGRPHGPTCSPTEQDINGECPFVYTTGLSGAVALGLGSAALLTGVGLLVAHALRARPRGSRARLAPAGSGLVLLF